MSVKYYYDLMSQPSRALYILFKLVKLPFEDCPVALRNGEHLTEEFKENLSRFQKVPFIHHGNFKLAESIAIVRYLSREFDVFGKWYPKDSKIQAKVDEYLEWQHNNVRVFCALYFRNKWLEPLMSGEQPNERTVKRNEDNMIQCLDSFEELFLKDSKFIVGDQITFADILAACEIEQPKVAGFNASIGRPVLSSWLERVRNECNPVYDDAHKIIYKLAELTKKKLAKL